MKPGKQRFTAVIYKVGINPLVDIPDKVSEFFGIKGYVQVKGELNGTPFRATLVPSGGGHHRLYVNGEMRKRAGVDAGDKVDLSIEFDPKPRILPLPKPLVEALEESSKAKAAWDNLKPSRHKEILAYLNSLKGQESLGRNVKKVIDELVA
jgi:hypothetical protein